MNNVAVISGAAGNLGQAVTLQFLEDNYQVVALVEPGHSQQAETLRRITADSGSLAIRELDAFSEADAQTLISSLAEAYTRVHVAVLLVGGFAMGGIEETDEALLDRLLRLNFKSAYLLARPFFSHMKQHGGGRIVLVGARTAVEPRSGKGVLAYSLAKTLVVKLADLLNVEGKAHNVITSVVVPNIIDTPQNRADMPNANFDDWVKPEEIARVISFACSPAADKLDEPVFKIYAHQ